MPRFSFEKRFKHSMAGRWMPTTSKEGAWPRATPNLPRSGPAGVETARGAVARAELQSQPHSGSDSLGIARLRTCAQEALGAGIHAPPDPVPPEPKTWGFSQERMGVHFTKRPKG